MNCRMTQTCPNKQCNALHAVYMTLDEIPSTDDWFTYICPKCKKQAMFPSSPVTHDAAIPPGAVVAYSCQAPQ
jgi:hypothetical protein